MDEFNENIVTNTFRNNKFRTYKYQPSDNEIK